MTYVVTETCIRCKYTDCVDVCPVDCFREGPNFLVIDPDECIDCTLCVAECPVEAIFAEDDVPKQQREFIALNAELAKAWKPITEKIDAPADADEEGAAVAPLMTRPTAMNPRNATSFRIVRALLRTRPGPTPRIWMIASSHTMAMAIAPWVDSVTGKKGIGI